MQEFRKSVTSVVHYQHKGSERKLVLRIQGLSPEERALIRGSNIGQFIINEVTLEGDPVEITMEGKSVVFSEDD